MCLCAYFCISGMCLSFYLRVCVVLRVGGFVF